MSSTRSSESAFRSSWNDASIVTCSGSQPRRSTTMFLKSSKLSFWVSNLASSATLSGGFRLLGVFYLLYQHGPPAPGARAPAARAPFPGRAPLSLRLRRGCGLRRSGCHAELGHQVHLVVHQVVSLDEAPIDLE